MFIDVVAYPFVTELDYVLQSHKPSDFGAYTNRLKFGGIKVTIDGSPRGARPTL